MSLDPLLSKYSNPIKPGKLHDQNSSNISYNDLEDSMLNFTNDYINKSMHDGMNQNYQNQIVIEAYAPSTEQNPIQK